MNKRSSTKSLSLPRILSSTGNGLKELSYLLDEAKIGVWQWDIPTGKVIWSSALEKIHGIPPGSFGGTFDDFSRDIYKEDKAKVLSQVKRALKGDGKYFVQYRVSTPDKRIIWVEARGMVFYEKGKPYKMMGFCMDVTTQKVVEEVIRESEEDLRTIFELIPSVVFQLSPEKKFTAISTAFTTISGWYTEEWLGRSLIDILHPEDRRSVINKLREILQSKKQASFKARIKTKRDGYLVIGFNIRPKLEGKRVIGFVGIAGDITKKVEEEKISATQYQTAQAITTAKTFEEGVEITLATFGEIFHFDLGILWLTTKEQSMSFSNCWTRDKVFNKEFIDLSKQLSFKKGAGLIGQVWKNNKPVWVKNVKRDKKFLRLELVKLVGFSGYCAFPVRIENRVIGVIEYYSYKGGMPDPVFVRAAESVSIHLGQFIKRKQTEKEVERISKQISAIFTSVPEGIIVEEKDGKIIYANNEASKLFGHKDTNALIGKNIIKELTRYTLDKNNKKASPKQVLGKGLKEGENIYRFRDLLGNIKWLKIISTDITTDDINLKITVRVFQDVTISQEEKRQREMFIGIVGHELKNPLTSIKAFNQLLQRRLDKGSEKYDFSVNLDKQTDRLVKLINDLLDATKITAGVFGINKTRFNLTSAIKATINNIQLTIPDHKITFSNGRGVYVEADQDRISQVLINLINNAAKYSEKNKKIVVKMEKKKENAVVCVKDYGVGIAKEDQKELFQMYKRIENPVTKKTSGLGIGLYISSAIIKAHQGKMWVKSKEGKGSIFFFSLPLKSKTSS